MTHRRITRLATATLLGGASLLTLGGVAHAQSILFSTSPELAAGTQLDSGREVSVAKGTVQVRLPGGAIASFVDSAQFSLRDDGSVDLRSGSVTIVGASGATTAVHLPEGVRGSVAGASAATFTANASGSRGSTTAGSVAVVSNGVTKSFAAGQFWTAGANRAPDRVIAGSVAAVPGARDGAVRAMAEGGIVAAAENGIPVALGEGLAGVGARGDVVAAARRIEAYDADPTIAAFPTGDYTLLMQYATQANGLLGTGGTTFRGAGGDIIRTYFEYLAAGNAGPNFRTAYAQVLLNYLDLLRSGVLPSTFRGATQSQLNAYLAFIGRTDGFGGLSANNRQLLDAYLAFLSTNGSPDAFGASVTNLTASFLNFVRGGGNPASFTQASATVVSQYLAIVQSGGLRTNLTAQNQALLAAYLANNGIGFTTTYATGLAAFVAYLNTGGLPSGYTALPAATLRSYLETLETTGLFDSVLGTQSAFLRSYLVFLRGGGTADQFNALPINIARVNAANLSSYVEYLLAGGAPTAYTVLTQAQIRAALDQLTATGQFTVLLGINAAFLGEYYAYIRTGADADTFAGLPSVDVNAYASSLAAFAAYLRAGNLPSSYTALTAQQIRSYLTALQVGGRLSLLGDNQALLADYLTYIRTGGAPDAFAGLPIVTYTSYATALTAYFAYLNAGGVPSSYTALTQAQLRTYLDVLRANGQFALLGSTATFYTDYLTYLAGGGAVDAFSGLPIVTFQGYAAALSAYFAYLNAGGLPSGYTVLTQAQVRQYLDALSASAQLTALLGSNAAFFTAYRTYLLTGASVDAFAGLPIVTYQSYATALNAYYAFLIGGGSPTAYTALTQAQIRSYLDALKAANQVSALLGANAAFFTQYLAFLETGGSANAYPGLPSSTYGQYAAALSAYFAYLNTGGLPSGYTALTQAQIREYLSVLQANNQLAALLGGNATFFANYLTFVSGGGSADAFTGLPIVTYTNYASALTAYYAYLAGGGLPAGYTVLTQAQIRQYLDALASANQITALLGANAAFFSAYQVYLAGGGAADTFTGLPAVTYAQYGTALQTFVAFLRGNGLPGGYTALTSAQIREYLAVLQANGQLGLIGSAADQQLLSAYATYLASGGLPNQFTGLPAFVTYEAALRTYYAFLQGGGKPSAYTALTQAQVVAYVQALDAAGLIAAKLTATEARFLRDYAVYVSAGNNADQFAGLPGNQPIATPVVTQGLANAPRGSTNALGLASSGKGLQTAASTSGNVVLNGNTVSAFSGANGVTVQTAKTVEARTVDNTIAIARLSDGTYNTLSGNTASANEGVHLVWGTPATAVPTTGTVAYGLVTATQPTVDGGAVAPGTFSSNLAVDLASRRVGWDSVIGIGGVNYRFASEGGTTAPSLVLVAGSSTFSGNASTANNGLAGTGAGFLSGVGGIFAGFSYTATAPIGAVTGTAIFGKGQPASTLPTVTPQTVIAPLPSPAYAYGGGFAGSATTVFKSASATGQRNSENAGSQVVVASDGKVTQLSNLIRAGTATITDVAGNATGIVGRWTGTGATYFVGPTASTFVGAEALHYFALAPATFTKPTTGLVTYSLLAATQPTYGSGYGAAGLFDAQMAINFATNRAGIVGTIVMPDTGGNQTYSFATSGGLTAPSQDLFTYPLTNLLFRAPTTGTGRGCGGTCDLVIQGAFGGATVNTLGIVYSTNSTVTTVVQDPIFGAALFGGNATTGTTNLPAPTYAYASGLQANGLTVRSVYPGTAPASLTFQTGAAVTRDSTGALLTSVNASSQDLTRLTAKATDTFGDTRVVIGRWYDGTYRRGPQGSATDTLSAAQSLHYMQLAPATLTLPTTGVVNYALLAATQPTFNSGIGGAGLFDAKAAIGFGTGVKFAIEGSIRMPEPSGTVTYAFTTPGGVANVANQFAQTPSNNSIATTASMTGTGVACTSGCQINFNASFTGADPLRIGATYYTNNGGINPGTPPSIQGAAIFTGTASDPNAVVVPTPTRAAFTYAGGFAGPNHGYLVGESDVVPRTFNTSGGSVVLSGTVEPNGGVTSFGGGAIGTYARGTGRQADQAGDAVVLIGRWYAGTQTSANVSREFGANDGLHYALIAPGTLTVPTTGTIQYNLIGATQPTMYGAGMASAAGQVGWGYFEGTMGITFGTAPKVGIEGALYMPETGAGATKYSFTTAGGAATPGYTIANVGRFLGGGVDMDAPITGSGLACPAGSTSCRISFIGEMGGANAARVGVTYQTVNSTNATAISGAAAFAAATGGTGGTGAGFTGTASGQITYAHASSALNDQGVTTTTYDNGVIKGYQSFLFAKAQTAGLVQESGRLADVIGWARWTGDSAGPLTNQGPNTGLHVLSGTPTTMSTLPTTGTAQYTIVGGTKPTIGTISSPALIGAAPGTITGTLGVAYGATARVGIDITAEVGGYGWRVQTPGGSANPSTSQMTVNSTGSFSQTFTKQIGVTPTTAASCVAACSGTIGGQFYGPGGSHVGLAFNMLDAGPAGSAGVSGIAIFAKAP